MSFDMNISSVKPVIREAQSMQNDGGGGNLGYMSQGQKEEKHYNPFGDDSIFLKQEEQDLFGFDKELEMPEEPFSLSKFIADIIYNIKLLLGITKK